MICFFVSVFFIRIKPVVGLLGATVATIFELIPIGIDDNLTMPLTSGFVMWAIVSWMSL